MSDVGTVSFVIATHRRRDVVLSTLQRLYCLGMSMPDSEIIVVDNASGDGTTEAIAERFPQVRVIAMERNLGSCAKAFGVDEARGEFVVFLDDDSFPRPGSMQRMVYRFRQDDQLGAAGFCVHLSDGRRECSAFPSVFIGCGVGFRRTVLEEVGGLDRTLFMAAEEYDLSFRLINGGWKVQTFEDLHVDHLKSPDARQSRRVAYYDTRNNLLVAARYLPDELERIYRSDWKRRYMWLAAREGNRGACLRGRLAANLRRHAERRRFAKLRLSDSAVEEIFRLNYVGRRMAELAAGGARKIVFADWGKNIYAFLRAANEHGLEVVGIADERFAASGRLYRGIPIYPLMRGMEQDHDAVVVANTSPVHALYTEKTISALTGRPVHRWFGSDFESARFSQ